MLAFLAALFPPAMAAAQGGYWACEAGEWAPQGRPSYPEPLKQCGTVIEVPRTETECALAGGRWAPAGLFPKPICTVPTADGGRVCGDTGECEGLCLAGLSDAGRERAMRGAAIRTLGQCSSRVPAFGCLAIVRQGLVSGMICYD